MPKKYAIFSQQALKSGKRTESIQPVLIWAGVGGSWPPLTTKDTTANAAAVKPLKAGYVKTDSEGILSKFTAVKSPRLVLIG